MELGDLPKELRDLIAPYLGESSEMLDEIARMIVGKRDEAKKARVSSGVELTWTYCEDAYAGIDDANRSEARGLTWAKPYSMEGPLTADTGRGDTGQSNVFLRMTPRYVDAGAAKLQEILVPPDDKAFSLRETPEPDLIKAKGDDTPVALDNGMPAMRAARPDEVPPAGSPPMGLPLPAGGAPMSPPVSGAPQVAAPALPGAPGAGAAPPLVPITKKDLAEENIGIAREKAKRAENIIFDWMKESNFSGEIRKVIADSSRLGVGILKGPFPMSKKATVTFETPDGIEVQFEEKVIPGVQWVNPWNIFPDPGCGEKIASGEYLFERDWLSETQLEGLKDLPGYLSGEIDAVIEEGPGKKNFKEGAPGLMPEATKERYETWYFHGALKREDMECLCATSGKSLRKWGVSRKQKIVFAILTLINDRIVRSILSPFESGRIPYLNVPWQRRPSQWMGIGVAEQLMVPQRMVNGATRSMLNNAGVSAGPQIVVNRRAVKPADGIWEIRPNKVWMVEPDYEGYDVRQLFMVAPIQNVTQEIMQINEWAMRIAEESTSIPLITQGQSGPTTPETFGAAQLQNNNANQLLRSIGYAFDDYITEPLVRGYYEILLLDPDVPADAKGDFHIVANGSIALVERAIQDQTIVQLLPFSKDPAYGLSPEKTAILYLKSKKLDVGDIAMSDEEKEALRNQPPPVAPQVEAAKIRAQTDMEKLKVTGTLGAEELKLSKEDIASDRTVQLHELEMKYQLALMDHSNRTGMTIDQVKGKLAETSMKLAAQERMAAQDRGSQQTGGGQRPQRQPRKQPIVQAPNEPNGRAPNGKAFQA